LATKWKPHLCIWRFFIKNISSLLVSVNLQYHFFYFVLKNRILAIYRQWEKK
jgi:hypothetical protein